MFPNRPSNRQQCRIFRGPGGARSDRFRFGPENGPRRPSNRSPVSQKNGARARTVGPCIRLVLFRPFRVICASVVLFFPDCTSAGDNSAGNTSVYDTFAGDMFAGDTFAGDASPADDFAGDTFPSAM